MKNNYNKIMKYGDIYNIPLMKLLCKLNYVEFVLDMVCLELFLNTR